MISVEQQALLTIRRVRQGFIVERTAIINRLRGLLSESGVVLPLRSVSVRRQAAEGLPMLAKRAINDLRQFAAWIGLVPGQTSTGGKTRHDCQIDDDETVKPAPGDPDQTRRQLQRPTNERGPGVRLSSGPGHSMPANRPVIVTQSVLLSSVK